MHKNSEDSEDGHAPSYYAATAEGLTARPRLRGDERADVCVIGGGFTGLSAALHLAERGYSVILAEARRLGSGASGRNGGQMNVGQRQGAAEMISMFGASGAKQLWDLASEARADVRGRIARHNISCGLTPGCYSVASKSPHAAWMREEVRLRREVFGFNDSRFLSREEMAERLADKRCHGAVEDTDGAHLHPLNYALGLAGAAEAAGARLYEQTPVLHVRETAEGPEVVTAQGAVRARHAVLAANAWTGDAAPAFGRWVFPVSNFIAVTEPLGEPRARALIRDLFAVHNSKFVLDYYRITPDFRMLFGGGEKYTPKDPRDIAAFVRPYMLDAFPTLADARIEYAWSGRLAITRNRLPWFNRSRPGIYAMCGFSGHGVALTTLAGKLAAEAIAGDAGRFDVFADIRHKAFPGGRLMRSPLQALGMMYYALRDRL
ncbi:MAG: NAD(P)/FAD-dependent oxidoreductase [Rhodospirillales bacterium]